MYTYYLTANSCSGYTSFFDEYAKDFKKLVVLKNITNDTKKKLFTRIKEFMDSNKIDYDIILHSGSADEIDAISSKGLSVVIADEEIGISEIPSYADVIDFYPDITLDLPLRTKLDSINKQIDAMRSKMFSHLSEAKLIHDEWENIYISNIDFAKLDTETDKLIADIFDSVPDKNADAHNTNRFFGTMLPRDSVNYIDNLTYGLDRRIFIKGRPGSGKSTLLKKLSAKAKDMGYDTETYYCSLDSKSLDMVIIRELGVCIFDSTEPHEKFPVDQRDEVFDVYKLAINEGTDEHYADELMHIMSRYNSEIKKAKECLYTANILKKKADILKKPDSDVLSSRIQKVLKIALTDI